MTVLALDVVDLLTANNRLLERLCDAVSLANADQAYLLADLENVLLSRHGADQTVMYPQWLALGLADAVEAHQGRRAELLDTLADLRSQFFDSGQSDQSPSGLSVEEDMLGDLADLLTSTIEEEEAHLVLPLALRRSVDDRVALGAAFSEARKASLAVAVAPLAG